MTQIKLTDTLSFGKHKGETLQDVIDNHLTYVEWCLDEIDWFGLDDEAQKYFDTVLSEQYDDDWREDWYHPGHPDNYGDN